MAKNQGLNRMRNGITRRLNAAERDRYFIYVSKDQGVALMLDGAFEVFVNGDLIKHNVKLDKYGRIIAAGVITKSILNKEFTMSAERGRVDITCHFDQ